MCRYCLFRTLLTHPFTMIPPLRFKFATNAFSDFWKYEDGKKMLAELNEIPSLSQAENYIPLLFKVDSIADDVIAECFRDKSFGMAMQPVMDYAAGKVPLHEAPESVQRLLNSMYEVPDWLNSDKLELGRELCNRSGKSGLIVLRNYSLMLGYQSAAINKPLIATGALHSGAVKRIADTTNFWYAVTGTNALAPNSDGFLYCLKTRLVHSYSRVMIKEKLDWDVADHAEPLNLWDMQATYLGFSLVFMRGLKNLGFTISEAETEAMYHLWKYIGYLIGIPAEIMPDTNKDAIRNLYLWSKTQPEADADSIALAQALHQEPLQAPWPKMRWQKRIIQQVNLAFNYHLIGDRSCAVLQLPKSKFRNFVRIVVRSNKMDQKITDAFPKYRKKQIRKGRAEQLIIRNRVNS